MVAQSLTQSTELIYNTNKTELMHDTAVCRVVAYAVYGSTDCHQKNYLPPNTLSYKLCKQEYYAIT